MMVHGAWVIFNAALTGKGITVARLAAETEIVTAIATAEAGMPLHALSVVAVTTPLVCVFQTLAGTQPPKSS